MIVENQQNIKVHFAGAEQADQSLVAADAGVKYALFTCFPYICSKFDIDGYPVLHRQTFAPKELEKYSNHIIMDSGLFTLMFGAHAGKRDEKFLWTWLYALCEFVVNNKITATCVEIDAQKVLSPAKAWEFRRKMKEILPNRQINVFHWEDQRKGLDQLIEFSDYIAISVPELRIIRKKTYGEDTIKLAHYIKNRKPEIDIHLLGCTQESILKKCKFCSSADSTSWKGCNRWGHILGKHVKNIKPPMHEYAKQRAKKVIEEMGIEPTEKRLEIYSNFWVSAYVHKQEYTQWCGNQD